MQSISFCSLDFENVPSKINTVYSLKFNTSTATVGRINKNRIVTFGKICHLPHAGTALICTVIKKLQLLGQEGLNNPISTPSFPQNSYSRGLTEEKAAGDFNLLANIGSLIAKAHQLNYS